MCSTWFLEGMRLITKQMTKHCQLEGGHVVINWLLRVQIQCTLCCGSLYLELTFSANLKSMLVAFWCVHSLVITDFV
jgi:hypothetical protein